MGKNCVEVCLQTVLLSLAMVNPSPCSLVGPYKYPFQVMSGSGDLQVLRLIRQLHVRVRQAEVTHGSHVGTHMALGLLFLGSGR
jgi:anaphase-promoting complex subunit 1